MSDDGRPLVKRIEDEFPELLTLLRSTPPAENADSANASSDEVLQARLLSIVGVANARSGPSDTVEISTRDLQLILTGAADRGGSRPSETQSLRDEIAALRSSIPTEDGIRMLMLKSFGASVLTVGTIVAIIAAFVHL